MLSTWWYAELVNAVSCSPVRKPQGDDQPVVGNFLAGFNFFYFGSGQIRGKHCYHVVETGRIGAPGKYHFQHFIYFSRMALFTTSLE